jgi:hypothetical protein
LTTLTGYAANAHFVTFANHNDLHNKPIIYYAVYQSVAKASQFDL